MIISKLKKRFNMWSSLSALFVLLVLMPSITIVYYLFQPASENWQHIKTYLLAEYFFNTVVTIGATGILTMFIGTSLAWIVTIYDFPLKKFLKWGLMLPLTIPAYIGAYTYYGIVNYTGVLQTTLRNVFDIRIDQQYVNIMSLQGVIFIFTLFLYPYVYTITRSYFAKQSGALIENARMLGKSPLQIFFQVVLPISRGAIIGGVSLAVLEALNDYGVVSYYGVPTFSTAIFKTWFGMGDVSSAIRLSAIVMVMVIVVLVGEKIYSRRRQYASTTTKVRPLKPIKLTGMKKALVSGYVYIIFALGFLIPSLQLLHWSYLSRDRFDVVALSKMAANSFGTALIASIGIIVASIIVANSKRISRSLITKVNAKIIVIGYSIPGSVIAIGIIIVFIALDRQLAPFYKSVLNIDKTLVLSSSIFMLIVAYMIRFMAIGYNAVDAGFEKVGRRFYESSLLLGKSKLQTFIKVDMPMLKPALLSGVLIAFIDIMKELPLTLLLRPFNYDSLATKAFEYANDEMIHEASVPSLIIIGLSILAMIIVDKLSRRGK